MRTSGQYSWKKRVTYSLPNAPVTTSFVFFCLMHVTMYNLRKEFLKLSTDSIYVELSRQKKREFRKSHVSFKPLKSQLRTHTKLSGLLFNQPKELVHNFVHVESMRAVVLAIALEGFEGLRDHRQPPPNTFVNPRNRRYSQTISST